MVLLKEGNLISQSLSLIPKLKARTTKKSGTNCHKKKTEKTKMWGYYVLQSKNSMEAVKVMMPFYEKSEKEQENLLTVKDLNDKNPLDNLFSSSMLPTLMMSSQICPKLELISKAA